MQELLKKSKIDAIYKEFNVVMDAFMKALFFSRKLTKFSEILNDHHTKIATKIN